MKKYFLLSIIAFSVFTGCAHHYYRVKGGAVELYLKRPEAIAVAFASSLDGYQLHPAEKRDSSTWKVTVPTYREFTYFYIVDGVLFVPSCKFKEKDDFGATNCIYIPGL
jgi:hypothetical protein